MERVKPYKIEIPQADLADLNLRLKNTRWTDEPKDAGWNYGVNPTYLRELVDYWQHDYDWRKHEAELNAFSRYETEIEGKKIQFIHVKGKGKNPTPIILFHGWPDSEYRYHKLIPMLTDPERYGGDPSDSFDVIVPASLIYPVQGTPQTKMFEQVTDRCWQLMTGVLGYERFAAAGGDGGSVMSQLMAVNHPESILGIHLTDIGYHATMANYPDLSDAEKQYLESIQNILYREGAYAVELGTKPQTWAFGLNDSPVGWAALVLEKFYAWSDCEGDIEKSFTKDELITNIMLLWFAGINPRGYREEWVSPSIAPEQKVEVPVGLALPPEDLNGIPPRVFAARNLRNIKQWSVLSGGGHFVAMERPYALANELRSFYHELTDKI